MADKNLLQLDTVAGSAVNRSTFFTVLEVSGATTPKNINVSELNKALSNIGPSGSTTDGEFGILEQGGNVFIFYNNGGTPYTSKMGTASITTLVDASSIAWDVSSSHVAKVTLGGNRTLQTPSGMTEGDSYILHVFQDASGSRTLEFSNDYYWEEGLAPPLTPAQNSHDIFSFTVLDYSGGNKLYGSVLNNFS